MTRGLLILTVLTILSRSLWGATAAGKDKAIDFRRDVRPILSDNCFACHGPDEKTRKAKLRLDTKEGAFKQEAGLAIIRPGKSGESELYKRLLAKDPDDVMPPADSGKKLTEKQIDVLKRWIDSGAPWESHWAFEPPQRPTPPEIKNKKWARNEIDRFVAARLEKEKLAPSQPADKTTLARRAAFDLTGLPPKPEEIDAFLNDKSPDAYEKLVDRLLQSPHYGEHQARYWLDGARYADSHGFHIDSERSIWKWRDWTIQAFNDNMRFDQFTREQLAGDLLPNPTIQQKIATGYVRCNMSTGEGGAITEEYEAKYGFDRLETTSAIWLGLTMTCARCHTHKYDPITHKEYYQLYAFFNNLDESIMDGNKPNPDPFLKAASAEQTERLAWLKRRISEEQPKLDGAIPELDARQTEWQAKWRQRLTEGWTALKPETFNSTNGAAHEVSENGAVIVKGAEQDRPELGFKLASGRVSALKLELLPHETLPQGGSIRSEDGSFGLLEFEAELVKQEGDKKTEPLKFSQVVASSEEEGRELSKAIDGKHDTAWSLPKADTKKPQTALFVLNSPLEAPADGTLKIRLRHDLAKGKGVIGHFRVSAAQGEKMAELLHPPKAAPWQVVGPFKTEGLQAGFEQVYEPEKEIDLKKTYQGVREEIRWRARPELEDGKNHVFTDRIHGVHGAFYLYRTITTTRPLKTEFNIRADDLFKLWVNGKLALERSTPAKPGEPPLRVRLELEKGENKLLLKVVNHVGECRFQFGKEMDDQESVPPEIASVLMAVENPNAKQQAAFRNYFRRANSPEWRQRADEVAQWREEEASIDREIPTTLVAKERSTPKETFMLIRGEYDKKGDKISPGVPAVLNAFRKDLPNNRLGLAEWLLDRSNPLTARVVVNRFWQQVFGVGLVKTTEDFGLQGEPPSHPELLDWLATEFIRSGWDVKHMMKLIVTSATYRQNSKIPAKLLALDPENRLLARGPRFRLDAEMIRDSALAVSGLLVEKIGGKSVKPYEPPGLWEAVSYNNVQKYVPDKDEGQYRRSMYTYWKRQSPPPNMLLFDAPTRESCTVKRPRTNTPLQALALLNDPQFVEASRAFGQKIMVEGGSGIAERIAFAYRRAVGRSPDKEEIRVLADVYAQNLRDFKRDREGAYKLLTVGRFKPRQDLDQAELAAWSTIGSMVLNLDEAVTKN